MSYSIFHKMSTGAIIEVKFFPPEVRIDYEIIDRIRLYSGKNIQSEFPDSIFPQQERSPWLSGIEIHYNNKKRWIEIPSGVWHDIEALIYTESSKIHTFTTEDVRNAHMNIGIELPF